MTRVPEIEPPGDKSEAKHRHGGEATKDDVYHAYRLLLGREPDADGWAYFCRAIEEHPVSPGALADSFMSSREFAECRRDASRENAVVEVPMQGFSLFIRPEDYDIGQSIRHHDPHVVAMLHTLLRPGHVFVDVGANIGLFTNLAAHLVGAGGFVVAVEPMDKNIQLIHRSLDHNGFDRVRVDACAASDRNGRVALTSHRGTSNGQVVAPGTPGKQLVFAQARRLDDLTADLSRIDLVKIDVEGCELLVWRGFQKALERHRPHVLTEFHPYCMSEFVGSEPREYLDGLFDYAGEVYVLTVDGEHIPYRSAEDVMQRWNEVNHATGADGKNHLDLFVVPRA